MATKNGTNSIVSAPLPTSSGYPSTDVGKVGVRVKGKFPAGTPTKTYSTVRGAGAAVRGKNFREAGE